jgi:hypothetical protein
MEENQRTGFQGKSWPSLVFGEKDDYLAIILLESSRGMAYSG